MRDVKFISTFRGSDTLRRPRKFENITQFFLTILSKYKQVGRFFQIFVAFSEYLNFMTSIIQCTCLVLMGLIKNWDFDQAITDRQVTRDVRDRNMIMTFAFDNFFTITLFGNSLFEANGSKKPVYQDRFQTDINHVTKLIST